MTIEHDAVEFGNHESQGGWRLGLLVARNVDPTSKGGRPRKTSQDDEVSGGKVSLAEFARMAGISDHTVKRHYDAWLSAAHAGYVPQPDELDPGSEPEVPWDKLPDYKGWKRKSDDGIEQDKKFPDRTNAEEYWAGVTDTLLLGFRKRWEDFNARYFDGRLTLPVIKVAALGQKKNGDYAPGSGVIRVNDRVLNGFPSNSNRGLVIDDVLIHEMIHQFLDEDGDRKTIHGGPFIDQANTVGKLMNLAPVTQKGGGATWPFPVRPAGYYGRTRHCESCCCEVDEDE